MFKKFKLNYCGTMEDALYNSNKILVFHKDARTVEGYLRKAKDKDLEKVQKKKIFSAKTNF